MIILRVFFLKRVLQRDTTQLKELYPGFKGSRFATLTVRSPKSGCCITRHSSKLSDDEFKTLLGDPVTKGWAHLGPGNSGTDAWVVLSVAGDQRRIFTIFPQSKPFAPPSNPCPNRR